MKFPDHLELIFPTIKALKEMAGTATPAEITNKVIELEKYPEEAQTEPQKGDGYRTKLEYRLAWTRTYI
jgi:restriction system protein